MKYNSKFYLYIIIVLLIIFVFSCKNDTDNITNLKENPEFDSELAFESKVSINANEIGGSNLFLVSAQDDKSILTKGEFNTVVSKIGEQFLIVKDKNDKVRALTLSTPNSDSTNIMKISATSTATTLIFLSPGILTIDQNEAATIIQKIQNLNSYLDFSLFLKNNLSTKSLDEIVTDIKYEVLLSNCITEYSNTTISKIVRPFSESKNNFQFTVTGNSIELQNKGFRIVNIVQRDLNSENIELISKTVFSEMGGAVPFSWGSLFTSSFFDPKIENINFYTVDKTVTSEFWIVGPGNIFKTSDVPANIRSIEQPWSETIVKYLVFPLLDLWSGSKSLTNIDSHTFKVIMTAIKGVKSTVKLTEASDMKSFNRELINFIIGVVGVITTSAAIAGISGIGTYVGAFFAISTGLIIAPANLGAFTANMFLIDPYCKFVVQQEFDNGNITITDIDGNVYHTVTIGTQTWMVENLRTTKYRDGTSIPLITGTTTWGNVTTPAYCWYNNDESSNKNTYGALYNWYAIETGKLAPTGWRVASNDDWQTLIDFVGGYSVAGGKLKETGTSHWASPNTSATNLYGFTALPGGSRDQSYGGWVFTAIGKKGLWWSSTYLLSRSGIIISYDNASESDVIPGYGTNENTGMSVRCIRN